MSGTVILVAVSSYGLVPLLLAKHLYRHLSVCLELRHLWLYQAIELLWLLLLVKHLYRHSLVYPEL
jgi:hypothetical protein